MEHSLEHLSPLGPGGQPFARWRPLAAVLAAGTLSVAAVVLLSDRAPGLLAWFSDRIDGGSSQAAQVASQVRPRTAFQIHLLLWTVVTAFIGLAMWSSRSLLGAAVIVLVLSLASERAQELFTLTRDLQTSDAVANVFGVLAGLGIVSALSTLFGWRDEPPRHSCR